MKSYGELGLEFKSGLVFAIIAFVLSIIAGLIGSVPFGTVVFRSIFIIPLFFFVGFGVLIIIKNLVPEVYEAISNFGGTSEDDLAEDMDMSSGDMEGIAGEYLENSDNIENSEEGFTELTEGDFDKINSVNNTNSSITDEKFGTSGGKLGKHIIVEDQLNKYEPKIMAEAIRTMMSKDE